MLGGGAWYDSLVLDWQALAPEGPRPVRRVEFEQMAELGMFEDERVELLRGVLVRMTPPGPPHEATVQRLTRLLVMAVADRGWVRVASSWAAGEYSQPLPDVCVVPPGEYDQAHPTEAWLVVEVSQSSLRKDRSIKAALYAECGVPEYWIVNLIDGVIEVHSDPDGGEYRQVRSCSRGNRIRLLRLPDVEVLADDVLPA